MMAVNAQHYDDTLKLLYSQVMMIHATLLKKICLGVTFVRKVIFLVNVPTHVYLANYAGMRLLYLCHACSSSLAVSQ